MTDRFGKNSFGGLQGLFLLLVLVSVALLYLFVYSEMPIYGDAWGYGYNCARWLSDNGLPLIPSGTGRGETAGGHGAFYFWLWALLMKVFGNTVSTAHLLPGVFAFLAVAGTFMLAKDLGGGGLGVLSGTALLAAPLFLAQAFRPLPIAAVMAASAWGLFFYIRGKYLQASAAMVFAVMMREQAMVVPFSCLAADLMVGSKRFPGRMLLLLLPFLVPVINGVSNHIVNGFVFAEGNNPGMDQPFSIPLFLHRLKFFGFFLTGHYRWLPVAAGVGFLYRRFCGMRTGITIGLTLLIFGAFARFQNYFTIILFLSLLYLGLHRRKSLEPVQVALALIPFLMILSFTSIVFVTSTVMEFTFFRYLMAAFPALVVGMMWMLSSSGWKGYTAAGVFLLATAWGNTGIRNEANYTDTTLAGYAAPLLVMRDAGAWAEEQDLPVIALNAVTGHFADPSLGYTERALQVIRPDELRDNPVPGVYATVIPPLLPWGDDVSRTLDDLREALPGESQLETDTVFTRGPFSARCLLLNLGSPNSAVVIKKARSVGGGL